MLLQFHLVFVFYSHWLQGIMILCEFSLRDSSSSLFLCFFIHISYRGSMILHELFQCDSSNLLCVWLCILIGYRGITILCELPINESSISLYVLFCIHMLYHDSLWVVYVILQLRFVQFCINIDYRGIMILHKLSQCDSSNSLSMWFCILIGYRIIMILHELSLNDSSILYSVCMILYLYHDSSWVVSMWFFNYTLCVVLYSHWLLGVSWFFKFCTGNSQVQKEGIKPNML